jgi:SRSO17 transposase
MDTSELRASRQELRKYLKRFDKCIKTEPSRRHMRTYVQGQVSDLRRKNVEQIAVDAGVPHRSLTEFVGLHHWDEEKVKLRVQDIVKRNHADENAIAVVDESGMPKKGDKTACVQPQYCGATGKIDNCVMTVHLGYVAGDFHAILDTELFLPEDWHNDRARCRAAKIPDEVVYRPKWKIALEQLERAVANGVPFRFLTADEGYGGCGDFREGVARLNLTYVVEVPRSTWGWTVRSCDRNPIGGSQETGAVGPSRDVGSRRCRSVDKLWPRGGPSWQPFRIKDTEKGPVVWEIRTSRFIVSRDGDPGEELWLIVARNVLDGEVKYFLSNAPADYRLERLLHIAFSRWHIERLFQDAKGHVGLDHFEVRQYPAVKRHCILSMVSILFLVREALRLKKKVPGGASLKYALLSRRNSTPLPHARR